MKTAIQDMIAQLKAGQGLGQIQEQVDNLLQEIHAVGSKKLEEDLGQLHLAIRDAKEDEELKQSKKEVIEAIKHEEEANRQAW